MEQYANISGKSGVAEYEIGDNYVIVVFTNGNTKSYSTEDYSRDEIEEMKTLAQSGQGLNTFLNQL